AGIVAIGAAMGLSVVAGSIFTIPDEMIRVARIVLLLGGVNIAIALVTGVFGGVMTAMQRFDLTNAVEVVIEVFRALSVFLALYFGLGLVALAVIQLAASGSRGLASFALSRRLYPELKIGRSGWSWDYLRPLLGFSVYSTLLNVSSMIILQLDIVVIGSFLPVAMIAYFGIAANLTNYARSLVSGISQTITPQVSAMDGSGSASDVRYLPVIGGRLATLVLLPIVITFMSRGSSFIGLWMGEAYADLSGRVLTILSLTLVVASGRQVISATVMGLNQHKMLVPAYLAEAGVNLLLSILLVRQFGIVGVAWGTTIPALIASTVVIPLIYCRAQGLRYAVVLWEIWLRPFAALIPFALGTYAIEQLWTPPNLVVFFAEVALVLPLAFLGIWVVGLNPGERESIVQRVSHRVRLAVDTQ
ncbi:MAG: oligosaccharide flippase family protein, partial [Gemmatimonas sp.]|nr:oligosaccharide flippase family protein [Gemmatimonas sp.]